MNKVWSIFQYGYLIVAVLFLINAVSDWNTDREQAYIKIGFAIFITLIFFFKRNFRKKIEKRNQQK